MRSYKVGQFDFSNKRAPSPPMEFLYIIVSAKADATGNENTVYTFLDMHTNL
jgi:hypothetical protein